MDAIVGIAAHLIPEATFMVIRLNAVNTPTTIIGCVVLPELWNCPPHHLILHLLHR